MDQHKKYIFLLLRMSYWSIHHSLYQILEQGFKFAMFVEQNSTWSKKLLIFGFVWDQSQGKVIGLLIRLCNYDIDVCWSNTSQLIKCLLKCIHEPKLSSSHSLLFADSSVSVQIYFRIVNIINAEKPGHVYTRRRVIGHNYNVCITVNTTQHYRFLLRVKV